MEDKTERKKSNSKNYRKKNQIKHANTHATNGSLWQPNTAMQHAFLSSIFDFPLWSAFILCLFPVTVSAAVALVFFSLQKLFYLWYNFKLRIFIHSTIILFYSFFFLLLFNRSLVRFMESNQRTANTWYR